MFNIHHDLDAVLIASLGVISIIWLGRNIYLAMKEMIQDHARQKMTGHSA